VPVPIEFPPSANVTVPVGVPKAGATGVTVAVNVTAAPALDGLTEELRLVLEAPGFTVWLKVGDVLPAKVTSPL
jgi:hypothetical protein